MLLGYMQYLNQGGKTVEQVELLDGSMGYIMVDVAKGPPQRSGVQLGKPVPHYPAWAKPLDEVVVD